MRFTKSIIGASYLVSLFLVSACTSHIPPEIKQPIEGSPTVTQVRGQADNYIAHKIRWGGIILDVENEQNASRLTIIALPLSDSGEPQDPDLSPGRFITLVDKFLEPEVYSKNRKITVIGHVLRTETLKVGEFPYEYPVIQAEHYYLWPPDPDPVDIVYPPYWWYDPWYDPYHPWHYPYYPHRGYP